MEYSIATYFLYFIILAICGWIMEVTVQLVNKHKLADRGFLIGPYCPIYGCGALLITLGLTCLKDYPVILIFTTIIVCGVLEYLTSYIMEKLFHARWWDYSNSKFNINGRVCLSTIIPFGILGVIVIYLINPLVFGGLSKIPEDMLNTIAFIVLGAFLVDCAVSLKVVLKVRSTTQKFDKENPKDSTEEITQKVREYLKEESSPLSARMVDAFPKVTTMFRQQKEKIKQKTSEVKEEITTRASEMKEDLTEKASEVKQEFTQKADKVKNTVKSGMNKTSNKVKAGIKKKSKNSK